MSFKTQDDIMRDAKGRKTSRGKNGKENWDSPLTPDFLLESKCSIKGTAINWIDAETFMVQKKVFCTLN